MENERRQMPSAPARPVTAFADVVEVRAFKPIVNTAGRTSVGISEAEGTTNINAFNLRVDPNAGRHRLNSFERPRSRPRALVYGLAGFALGMLVCIVTLVFVYVKHDDGDDDTDHFIDRWAVDEACDMLDEEWLCVETSCCEWVGDDDNDAPCKFDAFHADDHCFAFAGEIDGDEEDYGYNEDEIDELNERVWWWENGEWSPDPFNAWLWCDVDLTDHIEVLECLSEEEEPYDFPQQSGASPVFSEGVVFHDSFEADDLDDDSSAWSLCSGAGEPRGDCPGLGECGVWTRRRLYDEGATRWNSLPQAMDGGGAADGDFAIGTLAALCTQRVDLEVGGVEGDPLLAEMKADLHGKWRVSFSVRHWWTPGDDDDDGPPELMDIDDEVPQAPLWLYLYGDWDDDVDLSRALYGRWYLHDDEDDMVGGTSAARRWRWRCTGGCSCVSEGLGDECVDDAPNFFSAPIDDQEDLRGWQTYSIVLDLVNQKMYHYLGSRLLMSIMFTSSFDAVEAIGFSLYHSHTSQTLLDDFKVEKLSSSWVPV